MSSIVNMPTLICQQLRLRAMKSPLMSSTSAKVFRKLPGTSGLGENAIARLLMACCSEIFRLKSVAESMVVIKKKPSCMLTAQSIPFRARFTSILECTKIFPCMEQFTNPRRLRLTLRACLLKWMEPWTGWCFVLEVAVQEEAAPTNLNPLDGLGDTIPTYGKPTGRKS